MKPEKQEVEQLADVLEKTLSTRFINILINQSNTLSQIENLLDRSLSNRDKIELIIYHKESRLFAGSADRTKELRKKLIEKLPDDVIDSLFDRHCKSGGQSRSHKIGKLSDKVWRSGKQWPITFVKTIGIPTIFAGVSGRGKLPDVEDVDPYLIPPALTSFQQELKDKLLTTLNRDGDSTRCIISLPTGGGKTRTAVEAFIEWLQPRFSQGKYLIWIAQSEELCNQAIECIRQMWASKQFYESLRIYRYFGGTQIDESELIGGVVVASINQLHSRVGADETLESIVKSTGAIIIDEAHRAATNMYESFFGYCRENHGAELFPICGLTATPGRSFDQTPLLVSLFESTLFTPSLGEEFADDPLEFFRSEGYLARPRHREVRTNINIPSEDSLFPEEEEVFMRRLDQQIIGQLAANRLRNKLIIDELLKLPSDELTIVYACTVEHAEMLSTIMNAKGRASTAISSDTPRHYRRMLLEQFKTGKIQYVFNYGVLTTGFDAPKTKNIFICRPTFSSVLYEQIVGRGLRGPKFGGTEYCNIVDFADNFDRFGDQQAYRRFADFWSN